MCSLRSGAHIPGTMNPNVFVWAPGSHERFAVLGYKILVPVPGMCTSTSMVLAL